MTEADKIMFINGLLDDADEEPISEKVIKSYLQIAKSIIIRRRYPFNPDEEEMPKMYDMTQCKIAVYLINKRGAEGETSHSENGISRGYEDADVPDSMLKDVLPFCGVL